MRPGEVLDLPEKEDEFMTFAIIKRFEHGGLPTES